MEKLDLTKLFGGTYSKKKVLVTGHTGFKGSWLAYWLKQLGAEVVGLALDPPTQPNHFDLLNLKITSYIQDICDISAVTDILQKTKPDIIFHLAAQPLVRLSYQQPVLTYMTNIMGTVNILEAAKNLPNLKAIVVVTSDKCYENKEWVWGYRENDPMGGNDPYSSSKGCAELVTAAYRNSFFQTCNKTNGNQILVASARAGNVIGGGDWAKDRILTDIVSAASKSESVFLRYPQATRPWQHVLEPLSGYLTLGMQLLNGKKEFAEAWNFGPDSHHNVTVLELVKEAQKNWAKVSYELNRDNHPHEAKFLMLESTKSIKLLNWNTVWGFNETVEYTMNWYKLFYEERMVTTEATLFDYISDAQRKNIAWSTI
jgi:CDP-glucose 4,6-dehydratase